MAAAGLVAVAMLLLSSAAAAEPVAHFRLPGTREQWIDNLTVSEDSTLWVTQSMKEGPETLDKRVRVVHVSPDGAVIATSPELVGGAGSELAPASDSGAWLASGFKNEVDHVASDGSATIYELPAGEYHSLVEGEDGRAWMQHCTTSYAGGHHEETCEALAITPSGEIETFGLEGMATSWPPEAKSAGGVYDSLATAGGIWFWKLYRVGDEPSVASAEFISYAGVATPVSFPPQGYLAAPAGGDSVWWLENEIQGNVATGAKIGEIGVDGSSSNLHHMVGVSQWQDAFTFGAGRDDDLLWAQSATWSELYDGQIGLARIDGSNLELKAPLNATTVPTSQPDFWSGNCSFGSRLYEASDGALWTISGGHPDRLTRQTQDGSFETFLLNEASEFAGEEETGVWGMKETDPRALWFTLNTPGGPELARLNPLDPPPAEPRFPGSGSAKSIRGQGHRSRVRRFLNALLGQSVRALKRTGGGKARLRLRGNFPARGMAAVRIWSAARSAGDHRTRSRPSGRVGRRHGHSLTIAVGRRRGPAGRHAIVLRLPRRARALLRSPGRRRLVATATFRSRGGPAARRARPLYWHHRPKGPQWPGRVSRR